MTRVKFVIFQRELIALFPDMQESNDSIASYAHVGQHSPAHKNLMRYEEATKEEYNNLLKELIGRGYDDLFVLNKV